MKRTHNEDNFSIMEESGLYIVADGMGGHASGEIASKMAVDAMREFFAATANDPERTWPYKMDRSKGYEENRLITGIKLANLRIYESAQRDPRQRGMGTTIVSLFAVEDGVYIAHVGDSRVYRLRDGVLEQLTEDHSLLNDYIKMKRLTPEEIANFPHKNVIVRALGMKDTVKVDTRLEQPRAGDVYLLCSDGLSGPVEDPELGAFAGHFHPEDACRYLVNLANLRGGLDNITVIVVRIGPWVAPDSGEIHQQPDERARRDGSDRPGWRQRLTQLFKPRKSSTEPVVEEHLYRSADCPISEDLIIRLDELTRAAQEQAIEQASSIDWTLLATLRRQQAEAKAAGNHWIALRKVGEIISLLGTGARFHRKAVTSGEPR
jgi:PPM family protein phosphatase